MAGVVAFGWLCVVLHSLGVGLGAPKEVLLDGRPSSLSCGHSSMQFVLPPTSDGNGSFTVAVSDKAGLLHTFQNDTECGTWVSRRPDDSVVIGTNYTGCYVSEQDGEYVMNLEIPESFGQYISGEKQLKCPVLLVMDAPSPDVCAAVNGANMLSCSTSLIAQSDCEARGCCYNQMSFVPCYFGSPVTAYCTADGQATIAISAQVTLPSLDLNSVRLLTVSSGCTGLNVVRNTAFIAYSFPLSCGSSYQMGDDTVYENRFDASQNFQTWAAASISRDSIFRLTVRCAFSSSINFVPLQVEVFTRPPPFPVASAGPLYLEMRIARDSTYLSYYTDQEYPLVRVLQDPVYVEVRVLQRTDPNLVLVLNQCWATPSSNAVQQPQWPILVNSCPYAGDNYMTQLIPVSASLQLQFPSHYQRFMVNTFTFVDNAQKNVRGLIYFHCSASVCVPSGRGSCASICPKRRKRTAQVLESGLEEVTVVTSKGAVYFENQPEEDFLSLERSLESVEYLVPAWAVGAVIAVGFLLFLATVCLAVAQIVGIWKFQNGTSSMGVKTSK